jgi:hypothetical protein
MRELLKNKIGNEILQVLIVVAVIGALAITICVIISNKFKQQTKASTNRVGDSLQNTIDGTLSMEQDQSAGSEAVYNE